MNLRLALALLIALAATPAAFAHEKGGSGVEGLDVHDQGLTLDLLLSEKKGKAHWLTHQRSTDGGKSWSAPAKIEPKGIGPLGAMGRGSDAQVAAFGDKVVAIWTGTGSKWGTGPLTTAVSVDGGKTWQAGPSPTDASTPDGQSYIDLTVDTAGVFHAVWLDGRDGLQGLRHASATDPTQGWTKNETLMKGTCECCWNEIHATKAGGLQVLYREKDPRDMALIEKAPGQGGWRRQATVGSFGWKFDGCPHVGGALASAGKSATDPVHALVWTGMTGKAGLYHLQGDGGKWSDPRRIGGESAKHADLAVNGSRIAAVWDDVVDGKKVILASETVDGGKTWTTPKTLSKTSEHASHPRVVAAADGFAAFWTATEKSQPATLRQTRF